MQCKALQEECDASKDMCCKGSCETVGSGKSECCIKQGRKGCSTKEGCCDKSNKCISRTCVSTTTCKKGDPCETDAGVIGTCNASGKCITTDDGGNSGGEPKQCNADTCPGGICCGATDPKVCCLGGTCDPVTNACVQAGGSCPIVAYDRTGWADSWLPTDDNNAVAHGSNWYWNHMGPPTCRYSLPVVLGPRPKTSNQHPKGTCNSNTGGSPVYGFTLDVPGVAGTNVIVPQIGSVTEWACSNYACTTNKGMYGTGITCAASDPNNGKAYEMHLCHIDPVSSGSGLAVGTVIATTHDYTCKNDSCPNNDHVHIELTVDNAVVPPESVVCIPLIAP